MALCSLPREITANFSREHQGKKKTMKPFDNLVKDPRGMTYGKAATLAAGTLALAYYIAARRDTRVLPSEDAHRTDVMRPDRGTTQQVATDRYGQQHRKPPPSKKDS